MRKNLQKAVGSHFGMPIWLISMIKPPETIHNHNKQLRESLID